MKIYNYNPDSEICSVIYDGQVLKATLPLEQALIVQSMFDAKSDFDTIKKVFHNALGIVEKEIEIPNKEKTLRLMVETGFFTSSEEDSTILYRNNATLSVPQTLVNAYVQAYMAEDQERIETLDWFWYRMGLCPVDHARQDAFWFLNRQGFHIFKNGLILAARNIVPLDELQKYVPQWVDRVKNSWKQKLSNIEVYENDGEYLLFDITNKTKPEGRLLGTLEEIVNGRGEQTYTDGWTRKMRIKIGEPVVQPRNECNHNRNETCSNGLHFASIDHFSQSSYGGNWGATSILVAIDPIDLVAIPPSDGYWKGRCCRYLPLTVVQRDERGDVIMPNLSELEALLGDYGNYTLSELEAKASAVNPTEVEINFIRGFESTLVKTTDLYERLSKYATAQETPKLSGVDSNNDWCEEEDDEWWEDDDDEWNDSW